MQVLSRYGLHLFRLRCLRLLKGMRSMRRRLSDRLRSEGIKTELNFENEKIGYKIRNATIMKVPYLVIIGDKEIAENSIMVRKRSGENIGPYTAEEFIGMLKEKITSKSQEF